MIISFQLSSLYWEQLEGKLQNLYELCDQHAPRIGEKGAKPALHCSVALGPFQIVCARKPPSCCNLSLGKFRQASWCIALISYLMFHKCFECVGRGDGASFGQACEYLFCLVSQPWMRKTDFLDSWMSCDKWLLVYGEGIVWQTTLHRMNRAVQSQSGNQTKSRYTIPKRKKSK